MKKILIALFAAALLVFGWLSRDWFFDGGGGSSLTIALNTPATDLSPASVNLNNLMRTANVYEGLVAFDPVLKIVPALARSWGNVDDLTWEFKLRREVVFHDGTPFTAQHVLDRFSAIQQASMPQLETYLKTIKSLEKTDDHTLLIRTASPDPLLLSKLTKFFITLPGDVGTGPYRIDAWEPGVNLSLKVFENYWGRAPEFETVHYKVMASKKKRQQAFDRGEIEILTAVPRDQALELPKDQLKKSFSMEVNFLMFDLRDSLLHGRDIRDAIRTLFDPGEIEKIGNHFVRRVNQFVAPGVLGYLPDAPHFEFNEANRARDLFGNRLEKLSFDYLPTYRTLSEYVEKQLHEAGFAVRPNVMEPNALLAKIQKGQSPLFLIGWQAEDGDAGGFLDAFIHSEGELNKGRYSNAAVDQLIEQSRQEMDPKKRLELLHQIMQKIDEDLIGIPLFESARLYAVQPEVSWEPRLDGLVLAKEIK